MKYEKLKNQTNLHWYDLKDGRKLQRFQISEMIYALSSKENSFSKTSISPPPWPANPPAPPPA